MDQQPQHEQPDDRHPRGDRRLVAQRLDLLPAEAAEIADDAHDIRDLDAEPARALADGRDVHVRRVMVFVSNAKLRDVHSAPPEDECRKTLK